MKNRKWLATILLASLVVAACDVAEDEAMGPGGPAAATPGGGGPTGNAPSARADGGTSACPAAQGGSDGGPGPGPNSGADAATKDAAVKEAGPPPVAVGPTPPASWQPAGANLVGMQSECGNMNGVYPSPSSDMLIAGVARQGLWKSTDGAASWQRIGTTGDKILNRASSIVFDPDHVGTFWESGIYGFESPFTDGVFVTTDNGATFDGYGALSSIQSHNDSVAIDFSDAQRQTLLSGGHEQRRTLFRSTNGGASWTDIGQAIPDGLGFCTLTLVLDAQTFLVGCSSSWSGSPGAILRSTNGGASFTQVDSASPFGQPLHASDGAIYWAVEGGGVAKSTDDGATWTRVADGSKAGSLPLIELPDGRLASTHGSSVVVSADKGVTWTEVAANMPITPTGFSYSAFRNAFFAWYFTCGGANDVPSDAVMRFGWDYRL